MPMPLAFLYGTSVQVHWTLAVLRSQSCLGEERGDSNRRQTDSTNSDKLINLTLSPSRSCSCPSSVSTKATVELNMHVVLREGCPVPPSSLRNLALSWALLMPFQAATTTIREVLSGDRFREDLRSFSSAFLHCVLLILLP